MSALYVFLGGGTGALARWGVSLLMPQPWATVAVNLLGSFLLAALMHPALEADDTTKLAIGTGFLGSFTTYSTFNYLVLAASKEQDWNQAVLQVAVTLVGALLCGWAGWSLGGSLASTNP